MLNARLTPSQSVTPGKDFSITWDPESHPTDGVTVSLVLCHGPGSNCVLSDTAIAEGLPASQKSFDWKVPCDLAPGTQSTDTGYGMLVIVDGTGEFQCEKTLSPKQRRTQLTNLLDSTQFSVLENDACASAGITTTSSAGPTSSPTASATITKSGSSIVIGPPAYGTGSQTGSWGNWTSTATPTGSSYAPGTTLIVSTSGSVVYTYTGMTTPTPVAGATTTASTFSSILGGTSFSATASGPAASTSAFTGGANMGSSFAGMVVAGAVAVFAL